MSKILVYFLPPSPVLIDLTDFGHKDTVKIWDLSESQKKEIEIAAVKKSAVEVSSVSQLN